MKLNSIEFEAYKSFPEKQIFKIKPITIVVGKNSSGKSAFSKLPLLLANSFMADSEEPISLNHNGVEFGGSFVDLIHNRLPHGSLKIVMKFEGDITLSFNVQNVDRDPIQMIKEWSIESPDYNLALEIVLSDDNIKRTKNILYKSGDKNFEVTFNGLMPVVIKENGNEIDRSELTLLLEKLKIFSTNIEYIGPYRQIPQRVYFHSGKSPKRLGVKGENAPQILAMSGIRDNKLLQSVGEWYKDNLGWKVDVKHVDDFFQVVLTRPHNDDLQINIVDVGQGMTQVLPIIVQAMSNFESANFVSIIEQPELHLHPAAHAELAQLFAEAAKNKGANYILETHSENLLLRIRRLVVEGFLSTDDVVIYWIDDEGRAVSKIREIVIDTEGDLSDWPKGVFSEDYEEVLAIREAQKKKHVDRS